MLAIPWFSLGNMSAMTFRTSDVDWAKLKTFLGLQITLWKFLLKWKKPAGMSFTILHVFYITIVRTEQTWLTHKWAIWLPVLCTNHWYIALCCGGGVSVEAYATNIGRQNMHCNMTVCIRDSVIIKHGIVSLHVSQTIIPTVAAKPAEAHAHTDCC